MDVRRLRSLLKGYHVQKGDCRNAQSGWKEGKEQKKAPLVRLEYAYVDRRTDTGAQSQEAFQDAW